MAIELGSAENISEVISQVVAPSFMLVAVSGYLSMLFARLGSDIERMTDLAKLHGNAPAPSGTGQVLVRLRWRIRVMHHAILLAICSAVSTALLIMTAFAVTLFNFDRPWGSALLFIIALGFYLASMILLATVVVHSRTELEQPEHKPTLM